MSVFWLFIAKCHAVLLSQLRIPPPAQLVLLMLTGVLGFWHLEYPWGPDKPVWFNYPIVYEFLGGAVWFYDLER